MNIARVTPPFGTEMQSQNEFQLQHNSLCTILNISLFGIVAKYDVIFIYVYICTHAQQRYLTVTHAKWWPLHAGRNPRTLVIETSHIVG